MVGRHVLAPLNENPAQRGPDGNPSMKLWLSLFRRRFAKPRARRGFRRVQAEQIESRLVLSAVWGGAFEAAANDTLDLAEDFGQLLDAEFARQSAAIGDSEFGSSDVDWYRFELEQPRRVSLSTSEGSAAVALSLFNNSPFSFEDVHNLLGHRLLAQAESIEQVLGAGTYFVAVSGAGNLDFHPFLAGSGVPGETGDYELTIASEALSNSLPALSVLASDPADGAELGSSPFVIRVQLAGQLDPGTLAPDDTVFVTFSPNADFTDGDELPVPLATYGYNSFASEVELTPAMPLGLGFYQVVLGGSQDSRFSVLTDLDGTPLGSDDANPSGADVSFTFAVTGIEGNSGDAASADDTPATAHELGDVTTAGLVQAQGAIGDDPYYDPNVDSLLNPANDVDLYHFTVTGDEHYALAAEVFAGRVGSPLDSAVSLYRVDPLDGSLQFVAGNNNTSNPTVASNGTVPFFTDSVLSTGVTAGDYFVAVSSAFNAPSIEEGQLPGTDGLFDPTVSHSGFAGGNTGRYVLNLQLKVDHDAPEVRSSTPSSDNVLTAAPTSLSVTFSEPVNLQQLAYEAFQQSGQTTVASVFVQSADGTRFYPRLQTYDAASGEAEFLMLDALPSGSYEWHFSGALGLTDFASNPLAGNDASGDYVVAFSVDAAERGVQGDPLQRSANGANDDLANPQDLGILFPHELQSVVSVTRDPANHADAADTADFYRFEVLQRQDYGFNFNLNGDDFPDDVQITLMDPEGQEVLFGRSDNGRALTSALDAGAYVVQLSGWSATRAPTLSYELRMVLIAASENPPPLSMGAAPALQLRLSGTRSVAVAVPDFVGIPSESGAPDLSQINSGINVASNTNSLRFPISGFSAFGERLVGGIGGEGVPLIELPQRLVLRPHDIGNVNRFALVTWDELTADLDRPDFTADDETSDKALSLPPFDAPTPDAANETDLPEETAAPAVAPVVKQPSAESSEPTKPGSSAAQSPAAEPPVVTTSQLDEVLERVDVSLSVAPSADATIQAAIALMPLFATSKFWWRVKSKKENALV